MSEGTSRRSERGRRGRVHLVALGTALLAALALSACTGRKVVSAPPTSTTTTTTVAPLLSDVPAGRIVPLPAPPVAVAFLPLSGEVVVATRSPDEVVWLNEGGNRLATRSLPGPPGDLVATGLASRVVVSLPEQGVVEELDASSALGWRVHLGGDPGSLAVGSGGRLVVDDPAKSALFVVRDGTVVAERTVGDEPLALATSGPVCWTLRRRSGVLESRSLTTLARSERLSVGSSAEALVLGGSTGYVLDTSGRARVLSGLRHPKQVFLNPLRPGAGALAFDPVAERVWVAETSRNRIAVFDVSHGFLRRLGSMASLRAPDLVAADPVSGVLAVGSSHDAELELVPAGSPGRSSSGGKTP
jgi:DNA-binding beta-propeller fold protein YncE